MRIWLENLGKAGEIQETEPGSTEGVLVVDGRPLALTWALTATGMLGHFVVAGARYIAKEDAAERPDGLDTFEQVDPQADNGVSVWHICEPDYVAGRVLNGAIAWYVKETGIEAGELDFEAVPEDLETLVYPDTDDPEHDAPRTFRQILRAEAEAHGTGSPFIACSTEV